MISLTLCLAFLIFNSFSIGIQACTIKTSVHFSSIEVDWRGFLLKPDSNNATRFTTAIFNTVYNTSTSNSAIWTSARRLSFNSFFNSIKIAVYDDRAFPTYTLKINRCITILSSYSTGACTFQEALFASLIEYGWGYSGFWGSIGDFVQCGDASSGYTLPTVTSSTSTTTSTTPKTSTMTVASTSTSSKPSSSTVSTSSSSTASTSTASSSTASTPSSTTASTASSSTASSTASTPPPSTASTPPPSTASTSPPSTASTPPPSTASTPPPSTASTPPPSTASTPPSSTASTPPPSTASTPPPSTASTPPSSTASTPPPSTASTPPPSTASTPPSSTASTPPPSTASTPPPSTASTPPPSTASTPPPSTASTPPSSTASSTDSTPPSSTDSTPPPSTASTPSSSTASSSNMTTAESVILNCHNNLRSQLAMGIAANMTGTMPPGQNIIQLSYSFTVASQAQSWASLCTMQHSGNRDFGENLFMSSSSTISDEDAMQQACDAWWSELPEFGLQRSLVLSTAEFNKGIGHWSQMAWARTTQVGCAVARCPDSMWKTYVVCNYVPPGNFLNQVVYEEGVACAGCGSGASCNGTSGLCVIA